MSLKFYIPFLVFSFLFQISEAQVISQFDWESNPGTMATVGPDAVSISGSATVAAGGAGGTNGLSARATGTPKADVNLTLADDPIFDVDGIRVSIDFQREESAGSLFRRGSSLQINGVNNISITYRVDDGMGGFTTINSGNIYPVPNDDTFRTYEFSYDPVTGIGRFTVDGVEQWVNDGNDNTKMYWAGAGNIIIGQGLDASGSNEVFLDNLVIEEIPHLLPIKLDYFSANPLTNSSIDLSWRTLSEDNNDFFTLDYSNDGIIWNQITQIQGAGDSSIPLVYSYTHLEASIGNNYYRLSQTDFDGTTTYFDLQLVKIQDSQNQIMIYPNPSSDVIILKGQENLNMDTIELFNLNGESIPFRVESTSQSEITIPVSHLPRGTYFISIDGVTTQFTKM